MDDLDLLSRMRADLPAPDPLVLRRVRRQLLARAAGPPVTAVRSRRRRLAVAAGLAALLAGGLVAADALTSNGRPVTGAAADAAELLRLAADRTVAVPDPRPGPGQYRYVVTHAWYGTEIVGVPGDRGRNVFFLTEQRYEVWIPTEESRTWYWRYTRPLAAKFFSPADERLVRRALPDELRLGVELYTGTGGVQTREVTPGVGDQVHIPGNQVPQAGWETPSSAWLATLPRDPAALLARIYHDTAGAGPDRDTEAFVTIGDVLRSGLVPADLRAALYRAAAWIPGVRLVDRTANLDGRPGVAVGRGNPGGARDEIIFDREAGQFIGERSVSNTGAVVSSTAVTVTVAAHPGFR
jgi:hypothetical protein